MLQDRGTRDFFLESLADAETEQEALEASYAVDYPYDALSYAVFTSFLDALNPQSLQLILEKHYEAEINVLYEAYETGYDHERGSAQNLEVF